MMSQTNRPPAQANRPTARDRGDIQQGYTGDKVPGFDPAAAPLETDAEAAGTPQPQSQEVRAGGLSNDSASNTNSSSHGTAMRPFEADRNAGWTHLPLVILALGLVAALVAVAIVVS
jgi:hypothetical protein